MGDDFIHPESGEVLATEEEWAAAIGALEKRLSEVYGVLTPLRNARAERFPPAALPSRRNRTDKQALIARCPRCGSRLEEEAP